MSNKAKRELLMALRDRYLRGTKSEKSTILDELCATCGYNRKYAIRVLSCPVRPSKGRGGRPRMYTDSTVREALLACWKAAGYACGKRLHPVLRLWLPAYEQRYGSLPDTARAQLLGMSAATIDRHLAPIRLRTSCRGISGTKPGSLLKTHIPIQTNQWEEHRVGFLEADTVAHCGGSMAGTFVWTLNCVDIESGWTIQRAVWGKGEYNTAQAIRDIERTLPFTLRGFDCDNGGELLNKTLLHYFTKRRNPVRYTRSREYKSNDNAHVEGKNWTHVRQLLGYNRFDNPKILPMLNDLYENEWYLLENFFLPLVKLIAKQRIGSRIVRRHDKPLTPAQRLLLATDTPVTKQRWIKHQLKTLDPFELRQSITRKIKAIRALETPYQSLP